MKSLELYRSATWQRHYDEYPKTAEEIQGHGSDHRAYGWSPQVDPRWTDDEVRVYANAYEGVPR